MVSGRDGTGPLRFAVQLVTFPYIRLQRVLALAGGPTGAPTSGGGGAPSRSALVGVKDRAELRRNGDVELLIGAR